MNQRKEKKIESEKGNDFFMLKIFINPGHDIDLDPGACANGLREVDIALAIGKQVKQIMEGIGYPCQLIQSDNLNGETPSKPNVRNAKQAKCLRHS